MDQRASPPPNQPPTLVIVMGNRLVPMRKKRKPAVHRAIGQVYGPIMAFLREWEIFMEVVLHTKEINVS